jgi:hypothetical protein
LDAAGESLALATACKDDAAKFCTADNLFPEPGAVLTCLRRAPAAPRARTAARLTRVPACPFAAR